VPSAMSRTAALIAATAMAHRTIAATLIDQEYAGMDPGARFALAMAGVSTAVATGTAATLGRRRMS
jgi:hypothetical protein